MEMIVYGLSYVLWQCKVRVCTQYHKWKI